MYSFHPVPLSEIILTPANTVVLYNSTVTLTCTVTSVQRPNITWSAPTGVTLPNPSNTNNNGVYTSVLVLSQVTLDYSGTYTCYSVNDRGKSSDSSNVTVNCKFAELARNVYIDYIILSHLILNNLPWL